MFEQVKKPKAKTWRVGETATEAKVCGACNHVRQPTDTNPEWQCPGCGVAYNKVNQQAETKKHERHELRRKNRAYLEKRQREKHRQSPEQETDPVVATGLGIGTVTLTKGLGKAASACVKVATPANPWLLAIGGAIIAGTLLYAAIKYML